MLIAKNFISKEIYNSARAEGVKIFLYNEIDFIPQEDNPDGEIFFNCASQRVESTWYTWEENDQLITEFKKKFPVFFSIDGYDITLAIQKAMFWSNFKTGFLWYSYLNFFPNEKVYAIDPLHPSGKAGVSLRYFKSIFRQTKKTKPFKKESGARENKYPFAIHIKNDFQIGLYQELLQKVKSIPEFRVFTDEKVDKNYLEMFDYGDSNIIQNNTEKASLPYINPFHPKGKEWYVLNIILIHWDEFNDHIHTAELISHPGLKAILINEAENGIYGAVMSEVLSRNGAKVYNTMNGIKSGEVQDAYINFQKWFVWDKQMKELLTKYNHISEDKLIISGHLIEDLIKNYTYKDSLNLNVEQLKNKKVISLFSVKGKRYVKLEALKFLYELLSEDDSYFLIIRPHPSERPEDYIRPEKELKNVYFVNYNTRTLNDTLHDQLLLSDLSIVFGSTVSLDAKWMGVPCITFEAREKSLIYCVDEEHIVHAKHLDDFKTLVRNSIGTKRTNKILDKPSVSDFIIKEIRENN